MYGQCIIAVYPSQTEAEQARRELVQSGLSDDQIRVSDQSSAAGRQTDESEGDGFFSWLFGSDVSEEDRTMYGAHLMEGRTAVSVYLDADRGPSPEAVEDILERFDPIDVHEEGAAPASRGQVSGDDTEVIPLPEEELEVGKRATERHHRIRTYVVEQPVEKDVRLHDERVVIERRPASGKATGDAPLEGREFEIIERSEEPVVRKRTRADEEVVVHKEEADRVETVRDTVRKTEVDVDTGKR